MKNKFTSLLILSFALLLITTNSFGQSIPCPMNLNWELGDTTGWTFSWGGGDGLDDSGALVNPNTALPTIISTPNQGFLPGRYSITNATMPVDFYGKFPVVAPGGGNYSLKLGDENGDHGAESVEFYIRVPLGLNTYALNYMYAVVLNDGSHLINEQPRFEIKVTDSATGISLKDGCYNQNYSADRSLPGFFVSVEGPDIFYKPWTKAVLNISGAAGQTVKVTISTADCAQVAHFGYGYFDLLDCGEFKTVIVNCNLDREGIVLTAPEGYMTYNWWDDNYTKIVDTGRIIKYFPDNTNTQTYHAELIPFPSVSSCRDTISTIPLANISLDPTADINCASPNSAITLNANAQGGVGALTYQWTEFNSGNTISCNNCASPTANTSTSNMYTVRVTDDNGCFRTKTINVGINENTLDAIDDFVFCHPGYTQLDLNITGPLPREPFTCGTTATNCTSSAMYEIRTLHKEPLLESGSDTSTLVSPFSTQRSSGHIQYLLKREDLYYSGLRYGTLNSIGLEVNKAGIGTLIDDFTVSLLCSNRTSGGSFETGTTLVYSAPAPFAPVTGWNDFTFDVPFNYDTAKSIIVDICYTVSTPNDTTASIAILKTSSIDAVGEFTNTPGLSVCQNDPAEEFLTTVGRPITRLGYCKSPDKPFEYLWTPGTFLSDSTAKAPVAYITETTKYFVKSIGGSDCPLIDSVTVTVPIHDYVVFPEDTTVCLDEPFLMTASGSSSIVEWFDYDKLTNTFSTPTTLSCNNCPNPIALPRDSMIYAVVYKDKDACTDTFYVNVNVKPLPPVKILYNDTVIKYGTDIMLLVQGAYLYTWTPSSSLSNPNIVNPIASPLEPTLYVVYGIGENGCRKLDSVMVDIDYSSNLFVPTAFSPNGDGKNDIFRISNMTFQRLQEFKVFNRWGQEIYSTTDIRLGWDGSWKGQPQDMGVYQYIIKVSSPDGIIKTYKGDVTLVR